MSRDLVDVPTRLTRGRTSSQRTHEPPAEVGAVMSRVQKALRKQARQRTLQDTFASLQSDAAASGMMPKWTAAMTRASRGDKDVREALLKVQQGGRLADGSLLVKSSLGYGEDSGGMGMFETESLDDPFFLQMMQGLTGGEVPEDVLRARFAAVCEKEEAAAAAREPKAADSRPSEASTLLSRFDAALELEPLPGGFSAAPSLARHLAEARCEVASDRTYSGEPRCLAASGASLVLAGSTGYKSREPWACRFGPAAVRPPQTLAERAAAALVASAEPASLAACASSLSGTAQGALLERHMTQQPFEMWDSFSVATHFSSSVVSALHDSEADLTWLGESCGRRFKAFDTKGCCRYTLDSPSVATLTIAEMQGTRMLVAPGGNGMLALWDASDLDDRTGGTRMYRGDGPWSARTYRLDVLDGASSEAEVLSVQEASNVCWLEGVEEGVDVTRGEPPHETLAIDGDEGANSFSTICDAGDGNLALAVCGRSHGDATVGSEVVVLFDCCSGRVVRLFGHAPATYGYIRQVGSLSAAPCDLPGMLASGCSDGTVKIWDMRSRRPTHTLLGREDDSTGGINAVQLVSGGSGWPFVFSSSPDAAIKVWDLRADGRCLYELATGNACVHSLTWHQETKTLLALADRGVEKRISDGDEDADMDRFAWSSDARHKQDDFGVRWDLPYSEQSVVLQYHFKEAPAQPSRTRKHYGSEEAESVAKWTGDIGDAYTSHRTVVSR
jgi:WD40 repeat protein